MQDSKCKPNSSETISWMSGPGPCELVHKSKHCIPSSKPVSCISAIRSVKIYNAKYYLHLQSIGGDGRGAVIYPKNQNVHVRETTYNVLV